MNNNKCNWSDFILQQSTVELVALLRVWYVACHLQISIWFGLILTATITPPSCLVIFCFIWNGSAEKKMPTIMVSANLSTAVRTERGCLKRYFHSSTLNNLQKIKDYKKYKTQGLIKWNFNITTLNIWYTVKSWMHVLMVIRTSLVCFKTTSLSPYRFHYTLMPCMQMW